MVCVGFLAGVAPSDAAAAEFRVEAGLGVAHGDHNLAYSRNLNAVGLSVDSSSAINGSGIAVTAGAWVDGLLFKNLSFGLEYLHIENSADLDLTVKALGETVSVGSGADLGINALMLNAAWRQNRGTIHPYVALGAGATRLEASIDSDVTATAGISELRLLDFSDSAYAPAGQVVIGFDYDVSERVYVGAAARYFLFDGRLFGRDEVIRELAATVKLGIAF